MDMFMINMVVKLVNVFLSMINALKLCVIYIVKKVMTLTLMDVQLANV
jgi:hypothetical protein